MDPLEDVIHLENKRSSHSLMSKDEMGTFPYRCCWRLTIISHNWSSWWHLESWLHPHLQKQTILVSFAKVLHLGKEESWISPASFNLMHSICARMLKKLKTKNSNKNTFRHEMNKKLSTEKENETHWWGISGCLCLGFLCFLRSRDQVFVIILDVRGVNNDP